MNKHPHLSPLRLHLVLFFMGLCTLGLVVRTGFLQIAQHQEFAQQADDTHWSRQTVPAPRGMIKDREGNPIAIAQTRWEVSLNPAQFRSAAARERAVAAVAAATGASPQDIQKKLEQARDKPLLVTDNLEYARGKALLGKSLPGIVAQERIHRTYPEGNLAAGLLGFVGRDGAGLTGVEADFNPELAGSAGTLVFERDSVGNPIPLGYRSSAPPAPGADLVLTIDRFIQRVVERELDAALKKHGAAGGTVIVMQPHTGAILAMASRPSFDLRNLAFSDPKAMDLVRNRAVTDLYEPGSTFKLITMATAINEGLVTPETTYFDGGPVIKYGRALDTWDHKHFGTETMTELLLHSNNVGAVWLSDKLEPERFYQSLKRFGFGQPTQVGLSGEAGGVFRTPKDQDWSPIDLATNAFGQGITMTPLQLATAVSAIVNGGTLMRPYLVDRIEGPEGVRQFKPVAVRQVISAETSRTMRYMMNQTVEKSSVKTATVAGFHVGGKTGTATVPSPSGGYEPDATIASIVGFFPYESPRAVVLVKIDRPKDSPWGSQVASPVFSTVARELLVYWRVPPSEGVRVARITP
ncbi:MAG: penicillin-binding protein 2 [Chloroflexi bacterium]|nr:penicillin-binding protein 2 [Chloroflexota bacterium]